MEWLNYGSEIAFSAPFTYSLSQPATLCTVPNTTTTGFLCWIRNRFLLIWKLVIYSSNAEICDFACGTLFCIVGGKLHMSAARHMRVWWVSQDDLCMCIHRCTCVMKDLVKLSEFSTCDTTKFQDSFSFIPKISESAN